MNAYADKSKGQKKQFAGKKASHKQSSGHPTFQFVDKRPEFATQRKLNEVVNNSSQVKKVTQLQAMANSYATQHSSTIQRKADNMGSFSNLSSTKPGYSNVIQRQQTDVALRSASGTYTDSTGQSQSFSFAQSSKGSDIIHTTKNHPQGKVDYTSTIISYLQKQGYIPKDATNIVLSSQDTYGIKK
ncbi:MAG: hypothetical protein AAFZ15_14680 [Bacteroidota bacterium]